MREIIRRLFGKKWEYQIIYVGDKIENNYPYESLLNKEGASGWEFVEFRTFHKLLYVVFKRRK